MKFFKKSYFGEFPESLRGGNEDVICKNIFNWQNGPSFVLNGEFENTDPQEILTQILKKAEHSVDELCKLYPRIIESLKLLNSETKEWKISTGTAVFSFYNSFYSYSPLSLEEIDDKQIAIECKDPAKGVIDVINWDPWRGCSWWANYNPFDQDALVNLKKDRNEWFIIEDIIDFVKEEGHISFSIIPEKGINIEEEVLRKESKESGGREGYYENHLLFQSTRQQTDNRKEILRKEHHAIIPAKQIRFHIQSDNVPKAQFVSVRVFPMEADRIIVIFESCPKIHVARIRTKIDNGNSVSSNTNDSVPQRDRNKSSFFHKLFKK